MNSKEILSAPAATATSSSLMRFQYPWYSLMALRSGGWIVAVALTARAEPCPLHAIRKLSDCAALSSVEVR